MKKCKYHCDYGDGENCHFSEDKCIYDGDVVDKIDHILKTFYDFYQPTCRTKEDMHNECNNTKLVEIYNVLPLINPASIEDVEEAMKKCASTNK